MKIHVIVTQSDDQLHAILQECSQVAACKALAGYQITKYS